MENCYWAALATRIIQFDAAAVEELYFILQTSFRLWIIRQLGANELEDSIQTCFVYIIESLQQGRLAEPGCLPGYVTSILRRYVIGRIRERTATRTTTIDLAEVAFCAAASDLNPEQILLKTESRNMALTVLDALPPRDLEILQRFYLLEHTKAAIRHDLCLSANEFRNLKHRAKTRFLMRLNRRALTSTSRSLRQQLPPVQNMP